MKVTNCRDCPFRVPIFNDFSMGYDTADICALKANNNLIGIHESPGHNVIRAYDDYAEVDSEDIPIPIPDWCPLKSVEKLEITLVTK